ncbi:MAG: hypothetical protein D6718_04195 [Acidobacteria bacterium]|nr:MAG: hypothetical protein D6718_04195 [Acidobacteriota bacterium]
MPARLGPVSFPHRRHQGFLECQVCHHDREGEARPRACRECHGVGGVSTMKAAAHERCRACHVERGRGPRKCTQCHRKG